MRNRTIPLLVLLVIAVFAWMAHRPASSPMGPLPSTTSNESRIDRDGQYTTPRQSHSERNRERDANRTDSGNPESTGDRSQHRNRPTSAAPGAFDFYLLNLSWSPEFCTTHPSAQECATHTGFILHGLWPQNTDGTYPEHCSDVPAPADLSAAADVTPDPHLLAHEWTTHGTCSGLAPDAFFALARRAFHSVTIPPALAHLHTETTSTPGDVLAEFAHANPGLPASALALSCGNNRLTAIEVCLDKSLHPMACPSLRSCRANSIRITPP